MTPCGRCVAAGDYRDRVRPARRDHQRRHDRRRHRHARRAGPARPGDPRELNRQAGRRPMVTMLIASSPLTRIPIATTAAGTPIHVAARAAPMTRHAVIAIGARIGERAPGVEERQRHEVDGDRDRDRQRRDGRREVGRVVGRVRGDLEARPERGDRGEHEVVPVPPGDHRPERAAAADVGLVLEVRPPQREDEERGRRRRRPAADRAGRPPRTRPASRSSWPGRIRPGR